MTDLRPYQVDVIAEFHRVREQKRRVILVAPTAELAAREKEELAARQDVQELAPLRSEYLHGNYAKAAELADLIKSQGGSLISNRGAVAVDNSVRVVLELKPKGR